MPRAKVRVQALDFLANSRGNTWFHRLDPRVKLIYLASVLVVGFIFLDPKYQLTVLLSTIPFWVTARVNLRPLLAPLIGLTLTLVGMAIFIFGSQDRLVNRSGGEDMTGTISLGPVVLYSSSLTVGAAQLLRMGIPMATSLLVFATTDPADFARAINKWKVPREISFMIVMGLRIFPLALEEHTSITQAQRVRGVSTRGPVNRFRAFLRTSFPLLVILLRKSRDMGVSIESRGFGARKWAGTLRVWKLSTSDYLMLGFIVIYLAVGFYVRFVLGRGWLDFMI